MDFTVSLGFNQRSELGKLRGVLLVSLCLFIFFLFFNVPILNLIIKNSMAISMIFVVFYFFLLQVDIYE
jgi:hypothetical protein